MSTHILARLSYHLADKGKRDQIERIELTQHESTEAMAAAEARLIRKYRPPMNKQEGAQKKQAALGNRRILYSVYITPESKQALTALAAERGEQTATTVRTMLRYAMERMPNDYQR